MPIRQLRDSDLTLIPPSISRWNQVFELLGIIEIVQGPTHLLPKQEEQSNQSPVFSLRFDRALRQPS